MWVASTVVLGLALIALAGITLRTWNRSRVYRKRLEPLFDAEAELKEVDAHKRRLIAEKEAALSTLAKEEEDLAAERRAKRTTWEAEFDRTIAELDTLTKQVDQFRDVAEIQSYGLYEPVFDFDASERYSDALKAVRANQKAMIRANEAAVCDTEWTVEGSATKGKQMVKRMLKLQLRAFNGECDAGVASVRFDNVNRLAERFEKAWAAVNKLGETNQCRISKAYLQLKLDELRLAFERAHKKQEEKEEQRAIREQMREEAKARSEIEKAQNEAQKEEERYVLALDQARRELESATNATEESLRAKVALLEKQFEEAHDRKAKAISRAQLTKSGHVYVISNIGSFGDGIFKIGMTRRLAPLDRVKELGDASVPFGFDVHAMIYAQDAPALEAELHRRFENSQMNLVNSRREFFRTTLDQIEDAVYAVCGLDVEFVRMAVAEEYRESQALREKRQAELRAEHKETERREVLDARSRLEELKKGWRAEPI